MTHFTHDLIHPSPSSCEGCNIWSLRIKQVRQRENEEDCGSEEEWRRRIERERGVKTHKHLIQDSECIALIINVFIIIQFNYILVEKRFIKQSLYKFVNIQFLLVIVVYMFSFDTFC